MMGEMADPLVADAESGALLRDFGSWMTAEQRRIFLLCQRMLQDREEADSATQDTFLKAYQALKRRDAQDIDDPSKWLTRIAVNTCLDRLRSRKWQFWRKRPDAEDESTILRMTPERGPNAEDRIFARQISRRLAEALDRLSLRQRAVFTLRHFEDRSLEEIAGILGLDVGTVKAHMFRAMAKLREQLRDLYEMRAGKENRDEI
jgi:RNA polymerase sigma-70 factor, ECF subfamily